MAINLNICDMIFQLDLFYVFEAILFHSMLINKGFIVIWSVGTFFRYPVYTDSL